MPDALRLAPPWVLPLVEGALVVILVLGDPGRIDNRSRLLRGVSVTLVVVMASSATWSTLRLIEDITGGGAETNSASALLRNGSSVWATTVMAFALLFFELDGGGPAVRAQRVDPGGGGWDHRPGLPDGRDSGADPAFARTGWTGTGPMTSTAVDVGPTDTDSGTGLPVRHTTRRRGHHATLDARSDV